MNMTEKEFRKSTPEYFVLRLYGMRRKEREQSRQQWEIGRYVAVRARTAMADKLPSGFFELPWDEVKQTMTQEDWDAFNEVMDKRFPMELAKA